MLPAANATEQADVGTLCTGWISFQYNVGSSGMTKPHDSPFLLTTYVKGHVIDFISDHQPHRSSKITEHHHRRSSVSSIIGIIDHHHHRSSTLSIISIIDQHHHRKSNLIENQYDRSSSSSIISIVNHKHHRSSVSSIISIIDHQYHRASIHQHRSTTPSIETQHRYSTPLSSCTNVKIRCPTRKQGLYGCNRSDDIPMARSLAHIQKNKGGIAGLAMYQRARMRVASWQFFG